MNYDKTQSEIPTLTVLPASHTQSPGRTLGVQSLDAGNVYSVLWAICHFCTLDNPVLLSSAFSQLLVICVDHSMM